MTFAEQCIAERKRLRGVFYPRPAVKVKESPPPRAPQLPPIVWPYIPGSVRAPVVTLPVCTLAMVAAAVVKETGVSLIDIMSHRRDREIVRPRHYAMYAAKLRTRRRYSEIAAYFGRMDHSSAIYGYEHIRDLRATNPEVNAMANAILHRLDGMMK